MDAKPPGVECPETAKSRIALSAAKLSGEVIRNSAVIRDSGEFLPLVMGGFDGFYELYRAGSRRIIVFGDYLVQRKLLQEYTLNKTG